MVMEQQHDSANHPGDWKYPGGPRVLKTPARPLKFNEANREKNHGEYFMLLVFRVAHATETDADVVFTGDTLFERSVGRTDLFGGSGRSLLTSIVDKLLVLDDNTVVLPGHGNSTTIGAERRRNPFLEGL